MEFNIQISLQDYLLGLKRVDISCYEIFEPYYIERSKNYIYPAFYQSITQMIAANSFFYKIYKNQGRSTLAIFKRTSIMGNYSVMLNIAPISLCGNVYDEIFVIKDARNVGIPIKLYSEDIQRYRIPKRLCVPIKGNVEYIYDANECYDAKGGKFHNARRQRRAIIKLQNYQHTFGANESIDKLVSDWDSYNHSNRQRLQKTSQLQDWKNVKRIINNHVHIHSIFVNKTLECFSVIEKLSEKQWVFVMGMRNYESSLNDVNVCMHWLDCEIAHNHNYESVYANMGASLGINGLSAAKEKLKPCSHQQVYKFNPINKIDIEIAKKIFKNI